MNMSLHPVSTPHRAYIIRLLPGTCHPVLTGSSIVEYSSSGSHRVFTIRLLPGTRHPALVGYTTSGSHWVFRSRVLHIRFRPRPSLLISTVLLTSHPEGPVS